MKDGALKACVGIFGILGAYAIYAFSNPGTDGALFGTVMLVIGGLAGYSVKMGVERIKDA